MRGPSLWETRAAFLIVAFYVGKLLVKSVCETASKSLSCPPPPVYQDLSTRLNYQFSNKVQGKFKTHFRQFVESTEVPEQ